MNHFLVALASALILLAAPLSGAVIIPEYSHPQLQDKDYVTKEIERFSQLREELVSTRESASQVVQMTLDKDLKKIDVTLEALRYLEANGYDPSDPELQRLEYFTGSNKPVGQGLHHDMTPAGPRGGRVSYLDRKSEDQPKKRPAPQKRVKARRPTPRKARR